MRIAAGTEMADQNGQTTIWNRSFISLMFASMVMNIGLAMSNSLLAKYADSIGAPADQIGILMSTFAISALVFKIIAAPSIDTFNKKWLSVFSAAVFATAFVGFALVSDIRLLMVFRLIQGIGMAFGTAVFLTLASEMLPRDKYSTGLGYFTLGQVIARAIGPSIGLYFQKLFSFQATFLFSAGIVLLSAIFIVSVKYQFKRTKKLKIALHTIIAREAFLPAVVIALLTVGNAVINSFLIVFAGKQGVNESIGLYFTVTAITMLATRPIAGKLTDKFGSVKVFVPSLCFTILSFVLISISNQLWMFIVAAFISALGYGACQPAIMALAMKSVSKDRRGAASSTNYFGMDFGNLIGPTIAGYVILNFGYGAMWRIMTIPIIMAVITVVVFRRRIDQIEQDFVSNTETN